jgi:hypothetical protein
MATSAALRQLAVGDDCGEMIAHLADDIEGEKQFLAGGDVVNSRRSPRRGVIVFQPFEGFAQELVAQKILRAHRLGGGLAEFGVVHRPDLLSVGGGMTFEKKVASTKQESVTVQVFRQPERLGNVPDVTCVGART